MKKDLFIFPFPCFKRVSRKKLFIAPPHKHTALHGMESWAVDCPFSVARIPWVLPLALLQLDYLHLMANETFRWPVFCYLLPGFFPDNVLTGLVTSYNQRNILLAFLLLSNSRFFPRQCSNGIIYIKQPMKKFVLMTYPSSPANTDICVINDRLYSTPLS